ncbi:hypothetical protein NQZ79_g1440 [Umbelopsis isabellina]|nr:hypothetical protein NQZ79_g1440 [Umbelopsis isabellina]
MLETTISSVKADSPTTTSVCSRSPEALLSFTTSTATSLLPCSRQLIKHHRLPPLGQFIALVFARCNLPASVCLVSLIYLHRLKLRLPRYARGDYDTPYRLFLAAILTSSKFMSEGGTGLTSHMISQITDGLYTAKDVNLMERSFLGLMRYELWVDVDEVKSFLEENGNELEMELREVVMHDGVDWWKEL